MSAWQARQARLSSKLDARMGVEVRFVRLPAGSFTPLTGALSEQTPENQTLHCVPEPDDRSYEAIGASQGRAEQVRRVCTTDANAVDWVPARGDMAVWLSEDERKYSVLEVEPILDGARLRIFLGSGT